MFDYLIVGAGFSGSVMAERLAADAGKRCSIIDKRPHIGGNAYDHHDEAGILVHQLRPAHLPHEFEGGLRLPVGVHGSGGRTSIGCRRRSTGSCCRSQSTSIPSTVIRAASFIPSTCRELLQRRRRTLRSMKTSEDVIVSQRRPRAVREVLPQLHAQTVGHRSVRARRRGDRARASRVQPRRPLFHRHLPGDAEARLHAHVRGDARSPEHQGDAQYLICRDLR